MGTSQRIETALPMGIATVFVITVATLVTNLLYTYILSPLGVEYLKIIAFIVVIAAVVQLTEHYIRFANALLHQILGIYLPLITSNCAVLAVALTVADLELPQALATGVGGGVGFCVVIVLFSELRNKLDEKQVPLVFRGAPISLITAGIFAMAIIGFKGFL